MPKEKSGPDGIDIYPDGWGMKIENAPGMTEDEVRQLLKGLKELADGKVKTIEEIDEALREKGN